MYIYIYIFQYLSIFIIYSKRYQSWGNGRLVMPNQDLHDLRKAKKSGKMHEAMLDRREKLKSDSYCK